MVVVVIETAADGERGGGERPFFVDLEIGL